MATNTSATFAAETKLELWGYVDTIVGEIPVYYTHIDNNNVFIVQLNNEYIVALNEIELVYILNPDCIYSFKTTTNVSNIQEYTGRWE